MAKLTLDEMYVETAIYVDEEISKSGGVYTGDSATITNKFKTAINYMYLKIARERYKLIYKEDIVLDANKQFNISSLTKTLFKIVTVQDSSETDIAYKIIPSEKVECPYQNASDTVTVYYYYKPAELTGLTDSMDFPEGAVENKILCFYAAYFYLSQETDSSSQLKANNYLALFNDAVDRIDENRGEDSVIEDSYTLITDMR